MANCSISRLAIVTCGVDLRGGRIWMEFCSGRGVCVPFRLPILQNEVEMRALAKISPCPFAKRVRDGAFRQPEAMLASRGHSVRENFSSSSHVIGGV
jgi:hypothetical protein